MQAIEFSKSMLDFIDHCPSMFHTIHTISSILEEAGFTALKEGDKWELQKGGKYYTTRNGSSIIAFELPQGTPTHFQLSASHSDSPVYKIKSESELSGPKEYLRLNVEAYGGMIDSTWLDRPLSIAGRVLVKTEKGLENRLFNIDADTVIIPNVAIHLNRAVNDGVAFNRQVDLCPLFSAGALKQNSFNETVAKHLGIDADQIAGKDLFVYNRQKGIVWGAADEFVSSPKLDDLECAYTTLRGFIEGEVKSQVNVYCCFDNEEVGSNTKQGAMSTFLQSVLKRISSLVFDDPQAYYQAVSRSFLVSADNGHALHPNHPEKMDETNQVYLNGGVVIKEAANQKYTTDAFSRAVFTTICSMAGVPVQNFANRSDSAGGSTLGNLSNTQVSMHAVDLGLAQLAMHSSFETGGARDPYYLFEAMRKYYQTDITITDADSVAFN
jgi:aspartyl aminopeptidase